MSRFAVMFGLLPWIAFLAIAPPAVGEPAFAPNPAMARSEIPEIYKWDLSPLLESDDAFDGALAKVNEERTRLSLFQGTLADPSSLRECLDLYFRVRLATNRLTLFANLRFDTHRTSAKIQGMNDRALQAMNSLMAEASFLRREILALDDDTMERAYTAEPGLEEYRVYIEDIRRRKERVLGAEGERILALAGDNLWAEIDLNELPSDHEKTFGALLSDLKLPVISDENGDEVQLYFSNYPRFRRSKERAVRRQAVEGVFATLRDFQHVLAGTFAGQLNTTIFLARARGYDSSLEAYLDMENIDAAVYRNLISAVRANIAPLHRYVELRKKVLGVNDLHVYDLYTPLVPTVEREFTYDQARSILIESLRPLGQEYVGVLRTGLDPSNGWIDLYPHEGKESGAFSAGVYGVHPYIKMNFLNAFDDLSTLAHEYGHALHTHLAMTHQPYPTADFASFIAEVASTCDEMLLSDYLLRESESKEEKLMLLCELMESIRTTIYRQTLFAEFEWKAHEAAEQGVPITAEFLDQLYAGLIRDYYGPGFTLGENDGMEWAYVGHFYYKFYMYTYATGLCSGIALAEKMQSGDPAALKAYLNMLKSGSSAPPLVLLQRAGVDLTKPDAIEAAAGLMDRTIGEVERLLEFD